MSVAQHPACTHASKDWWNKWSNDEWDAYYQEESEKKQIKWSPGASGATTSGTPPTEWDAYGPEDAKIEQAEESTPGASSSNLHQVPRLVIDVDNEDSQWR